jgi:hypothetical protein
MLSTITHFSKNMAMLSTVGSVPRRSFCDAASKNSASPPAAYGYEMETRLVRMLEQHDRSMDRKLTGLYGLLGGCAVVGALAEVFGFRIRMLPS